MSAPLKNRTWGNRRSPKLFCPLCYESYYKHTSRYACRNCGTEVYPIILSQEYIDQNFVVLESLHMLYESPATELLRMTWFNRARNNPTKRFFRCRFKVIGV
jgi:hypothetical protein